MFNDRKAVYAVLILAGAVSLAALFLYFGAGNGNGKNGDKEIGGQESVSAQKNLPETAAYANNDFRVSFEYPSLWKPDPAGRKFNENFLSFSGSDGFFVAGVLVAQGSISEVENISIDGVARHLLQTSNDYGSTPVISTTTLSGMDSSYIFPSADQPPNASRKATLIVRYPRILAIGSTTLPFFILDADKAHLESIAKTLKFINF